MSLEGRVNWECTPEMCMEARMGADINYTFRNSPKRGLYVNMESKDVHREFGNRGFGELARW